MRSRILFGVAALTVAVAGWSLAQPPRGQRQPQPGQEPNAAAPIVQPRGLQPRAFVITDARIVTEPGTTLPKATIVIRDGLIEAVGADIKAPPDALKIPGDSLTVYPGFVDACGTWGYDAALRRSEIGPTSAEDLASESLAATKADNRKGLTPEFLVNQALKTDDEANEAWRKVGFTAHLVAPDGGFISGQSAVVSHSGAAARDAILRAPFALQIALKTSFGPGAGEGYPRALMGVFAHCRQTLLDAQHYQRLHQAFEKSGGVGKRPPHDPSLEALLPALDGKIPVVMEADGRDAIHRSLDFAAEFKLKPILTGGREAWKVADRLKKENVPVILRLAFAEPNDEREKDLPRRALDERRRLRAEEFQTAQRLIDAGVTVAFATAGLTDRPWEKFPANLRKIITAGLSPDAALAALTTGPAKVLGLEGQLGRIAAGRPAHLVVMTGDFNAEKTQTRMVFADGVRFEFEPPAPEPTANARGGRGPGGPGGSGGRFGGRDRGERTDADVKPAPFVGPPTAEDDNTEIDADRIPSIKTGGNVLVRNATVFTVTNGAKPNCDILVRNGKIAAIGPNLAPDASMTVIDGTGLSVIPGIIDTHSHFAASGGLNEFSLSVVPEVRVRDVVEGDDVQIYRALAGGVTTARILHGSANCVGGQDAVLKMKYGKPGRELIVTDRPRGVKFALGENVKRTDGRFPNTRLGVEAVLIRAFSEAQDYRKEWDAYDRAKKDGKPVVEPRRDLRLEALADILNGDLKVHCHCYRADEILMLLRVADKFGFKIQSLQHVLEGYKIAPEIAAHGASVSLFSDWWAYKIEAFDAIPYAAALLRAAGASVCLKSDSNELMRHLYQEATKLMKYGGLGETDALASITLNCAKQLGIDQRVGSLDIGKDADLAIFNGHPLNSFSRVELTLVEGEVYFQRSRELKSETMAAAPPVAPRDNAVKLPDRVSGPIAIRGATIHPVSGPSIENGTVVIDQGRIRAVGSNGSAGIPANATIIPAEGLHLYPGLIDAGTVLGLAELESARETNDFREGGDFQPDLRASIAINPDSELIPVTRANGVTTVVTRPSGSVVAGQSVLLNLAGWTPREMTVIDGLALHVEFPTVNVPFGRGGDPAMAEMFGGRGLQKKQRDEKIRRLRELFAQAIAYDEGRKLSPSAPANPRLEAVVPYARGEKPVVIQASRKADILDVLKLADELKLKLIVSGATDAWRVTDELKKRDVPVIVGPIMAMPQEREESYDAPFTNPAKLYAAGVKFCIRTGTNSGSNSGSSNTRNLPYEAAFAVSYGLPEEEGLKAITLYPAQILGAEKELGSIDIGKRANLVLTTGNPMQASSQVQAVFIDGKPLEPTSKQTRLYDRYKERLREVQEGRAPLGTK
jgi:imidazolonepropionase-like amidohydrolase